MFFILWQYSRSELGSDQMWIERISRARHHKRSEADHPFVFDSNGGVDEFFIPFFNLKLVGSYVGVQ